MIRLAGPRGLSDPVRLTVHVLLVEGGAGACTFSLICFLNKELTKNLVDLKLQILSLCPDSSPSFIPPQLLRALVNVSSESAA